MTRHISDHCQKAVQQLRERQALKDCLEGAAQGLQAAQDKLDLLQKVSITGWNKLAVGMHFCVPSAVTARVTRCCERRGNSLEVVMAVGHTWLQTSTSYEFVASGSNAVMAADGQ